LATGFATTFLATTFLATTFLATGFATGFLATGFFATGFLATTFLVPGLDAADFELFGRAFWTALPDFAVVDFVVFDFAVVDFDALDGFLAADFPVAIVGGTLPFGTAARLYLSPERTTET
jgi:hypothetical protein